MGLSRIVYASREKEHFGLLEIQGLLKEARSFNGKSGITGVLLYDQGLFFQVLEGESEAITLLYQKIAKDPRHEQVTTVIQEPIESRYFGNWSMAFVSSYGEGIGKVSGLKSFFDAGHNLLQLSPVQANLLIQEIAGGQWTVL
ncbi:MAG: BLUF domain-containing protein [Zetaproteobacteria bacterium]|nr:BLUF domain-containing protein [Zetaproteobacteria bacterium]